jgi:hypothetical protein
MQSNDYSSIDPLHQVSQKPQFQKKNKCILKRSKEGMLQTLYSYSQIWRGVNMTGLTSGAGTAYPSGAPHFNYNLLFSVYCNPRNENLNLLVQIKFLNLLLYSSNKNWKMYRSKQSLAGLGARTPVLIVRTVLWFMDYYLYFSSFSFDHCIV